MPTPIDDSYKNTIGMKLTNRLGLALEQKEIDAGSAADVIDLMLPIFETMKYKEQLFALFNKLSNGWPFFAELIEEEEKKDTAVQSIEALFQDRKIQLVGVSKGD